MGTSTARVSNPTRLKSSTSDIMAMFKAANRGGRDEESEFRGMIGLGLRCRSPN